MKRDKILDAVKRTVTQDRNDRHGEPENTFPRIAEAWNDYLDRRGLLSPSMTGDRGALKPSDVAEMLAIFKTCRFEVQPDNPDNEHDRIGYYAIAAELRAAERNTPIKNELSRKKLTADVIGAGEIIKPSRQSRLIIRGIPVDSVIESHQRLPDGKFAGEIIAKSYSSGAIDFFKFDGTFWREYEPSLTLNYGNEPFPPGVQGREIRKDGEVWVFDRGEWVKRSDHQPQRDNP